jgi:UDP-2-acetamido-3-amino-2,3-dideoxy-glucuronate N-acetyltransferase
MVKKYHYEYVGVNSRLDTIQAAILKVKLQYLDNYNQARQKAASVYNDAFKNIPGIVIPTKTDNTSHIYHQYTLKICNGKRDLLQSHLENNKIPSMIYYPVSLHVQPAYEDLGYKEGDFPVSEAICKEVLSLPMHTELDEEQLQFITEKVIESGIMKKEYFAHETAVIDEGCHIGKGSKIWHFTHIMPDCEIGENCNLGQNVVVSPKVKLGKNVKVQNNVSIYTGVICEDDVFLGPSMVFTNVTNPRSVVVRRDKFLITLVKQGATIGANATIICGHTIGKYAFIGAGAVVTRDVADYSLVIGNGIAICPESGEKYQFDNMKVQKI